MDSEPSIEYEPEPSVGLMISMWLSNLSEMITFDIKSYFNVLMKANDTDSTKFDNIVSDFVDFFKINSEFIDSDVLKIQGKYGSIDFPDLSLLSDTNKIKFRNMTHFCLDMLK